MAKTRVVVAGATGKTGGAVTRVLLRSRHVEIVGAVARRHAGQDLGIALGTPPTRIVVEDDLPAALTRLQPDVFLDFTAPDVVVSHIEAAIARRVPAVVGTTGISSRQLRELGEAAAEQGVGLLSIANFSIGAMLLTKFVRIAATYLPDVEVIEKHHAAKVDAPSGTAIRLAEAIVAAGGRESVPMHSVRLPGLVAHHEVLFGGHAETLTLKHDTISREAFAPGVEMALRVAHLFTGLITDFETVFNTFHERFGSE